MASLIDRPTMEQLRRRREEILRIVAIRGAHNVRVFGSVARGDAQPGSDVDFLIDLDPGRRLFKLSELILDLKQALERKVSASPSVGVPPRRAGEEVRR